MDAEALRDGMLLASGELDLRMGGPGFYPVMEPEVLEGFSRKGEAWTASPESERMRRSVYMVSKRHLLLPFMTAFDFPNSEQPCGRRDVTTVAPQALAMMNNRFVHERSEALARLAEREGAGDDGAIRAAWRGVFAREPADAELAGARRHFERQRAHFAAAVAGDGEPSARFRALASLAVPRPAHVQRIPVCRLVGDSAAAIRAA
jgi:hypothetical protein